MVKPSLIQYTPIYKAEQFPEELSGRLPIYCTIPHNLQDILFKGLNSVISERSGGILLAFLQT